LKKQCASGPASAVRSQFNGGFFNFPTVEQKYKTDNEVSNDRFVRFFYLSVLNAGRSVMGIKLDISRKGVITLAGAKAIVQISNVNKYYDRNHVVSDLNMEVYEGEFLSILGPSGCGKTTTLRMIAGFEQQTEGVITVEGERVEDKEPFDRNVNTVFQSYALFPHMNVYDNIAFGLKMKKTAKAQIKKMVTDTLAMVQLTGFEKRFPAQLSGGQKQRVAIARAIVNKPRVLLLDEPLGALDMKLRKQMQIEMKRLQKKLGITFIYVTHDQEEAMTMSDRIAVMNAGVLEQIDVPGEIYEHPKSRFVADFIGESNLFDTVVDSAEDDIYHLKAESGDVLGSGGSFKPNELICVSVRPEKTKYSEKPVSGFSISGVVRENIYIGTLVKSIIVLQNDHELKICTLAGEPYPKSGTMQYVYWEPKDAVLMPTYSQTVHALIDNVDLGDYIDKRKDSLGEQAKVAP
jgi:spermidine/putrescine transport system ATP-binding protein